MFLHHRRGLTLLLSLLVVSGAGVRLQGQPPLPVSFAPESIRQGDVVRITIADPDPSAHFTATLADQAIDFHYDGEARVWIALAGIDLDTAPGRYRVQIARGGHARATRTIAVLDRKFTVRRLKVAPSFVTPPPEALEQIAIDGKALAAAYARESPKQWRGAFRLPVDGKASSNFGTRSYFNGQARSPHSGIDFSASSGTPIRAGNHGTVALAQAMYFTGNTVVVDYGSRLLSVFAHLSAFRVAAGDTVGPDTIVGLVGATGRVTGPHLHWSVRLNGARVDPLSLVAATEH